MVRAAVVPALLVCFSLVAQTPSPAESKRLTLREAIQVSLENNLQVGIAQAARQQTQSSVTISEGAFDWNLAANASLARLNNASKSTAYATDGFSYLGQNQNTVYNRALSTTVSKPFEWGGSISLNYSPAYYLSRGSVMEIGKAVDPGTGALVPVTTTGGTPNPYSGSFTASYTQSLLQGFGTHVATANLVVSKKNAQAADYTFQLAIINLVSATEGQYWDLVFAERDLANKRISLDLAAKQLKENKIRVEVGTMAPIEVDSAEAQVAQAEQNIIAAEATLKNAQDALQRALFPNVSNPPVLAPSDAPDIEHVQVDETSAVKMAMDRRLELKNASLTREIARLQQDVAQDKVRPQLNATLSYNGATDAYGAIGPVNSDITGFKYPGYTIGLQFAMPIQNRAAKGALSSARAYTRSQELNLHDTELNIALQARTAARNVEAAEKGVKAAAKTRYYQERNLDAEMKKFDNGMSTNFTVLQVMTNLDNAKSAELTAQIAYAKAATALEVAVGNLMEARHFTVK